MENDINPLKEYEIFVEARKNSNYYKGEILPFIHKVCRKNMTTGDIDAFIWDFYKKVYINIEQKWKCEGSKLSQDRHLRFKQTIFNAVIKTEEFKEWNMSVYKIKGDPPFHNATIYEYPFSDTNKSINVTQDELIKFFNLEISYDELKKYKIQDEDQMELPF